MKGDIFLGVLFLNVNFPGGVNPAFKTFWYIIDFNTDDITNFAIDFCVIVNYLVNIQFSQIWKSFTTILAYTAHFRAK